MEKIYKVNLPIVYHSCFSSRKNSSLCWQLDTLCIFYNIFVVCKYRSNYRKKLLIAVIYYLLIAKQEVNSFRLLNLLK